jgi:nicotinamide-nucleotide amidase
VSAVPRDDAALTVLAEAVGSALRAREFRLATAESCTAGWIAKAITDVAGSSAWFDSAAVTYSNAAKMRDLGVADALLLEHGAVSEAVVGAMAAGMYARSACEAVIAVSGIAGPDGGTADKPVGLVCFAWLIERVASTERAIFSGDRQAVRRAAVEFALQGLLSRLD